MGYFQIMWKRRWYALGVFILAVSGSTIYATLIGFGEAPDARGKIMGMERRFLILFQVKEVYARELQASAKLVDKSAFPGTSGPEQKKAICLQWVKQPLKLTSNFKRIFEVRQAFQAILCLCSAKYIFRAYFLTPDFHAECRTAEVKTGA
jgi:hypothetical protein